MKGIILAGGSGSRLHPITQGCSKQLLPVYDKPMIYYPLSVLMLAGIREILVITTPEDSASFQRLLGDGHQFGVQLQYAQQPQPQGIAQALLIGASFVAGEPVCLILGDNLFFGSGLRERLARCRQRQQGATLFGYRVEQPQRYGVIEFDGQQQIRAIHEKPAQPPSDYAVTGLYFYDGQASQLAQQLTPSPRGELEITDLNNLYLQKGEAHLELLGRGYAWLDTGTPASLLEAGNFIQTIEHRQGLKIACLEEIAYCQGWIDLPQLEQRAQSLAHSDYGQYLLKLAQEPPAHWNSTP